MCGFFFLFYNFFLREKKKRIKLSNFHEWSTDDRNTTNFLNFLMFCSWIPLQETSSAQYILQQYIAASGGLKLQNSIRNAYAMGKVRMVASEFETATRVVKNRNASRCAESGGFVLWQMNPNMWYVELAVGGSKVHAGCNGKLVWRHTPWLGAHTAKGPVRPLRRALQVEPCSNVPAAHVPFVLILAFCSLFLSSF